MQPLRQRPRRLTPTEFGLVGTAAIVALIAFASYLDEDPLADLHVEQAQADAESDYELGVQEGERRARTRLMQVYQQGLTEGAQGAVGALQGDRDVQVAQACLALGYTRQDGKAQLLGVR